MARRLILTMLVTVAFSLPALADDAKPTMTHIDLNDGDTLVFLGDSITHQCLYTQYVEDYYYTRYPKKRIHFRNAGIGGDAAADALRRLDDDVLAFQPKYVTLLLGMNDGGYMHSDVWETFKIYEQGMTELLDRIAAAGAVAIPMTPTMYDFVPGRKIDNPYLKEPCHQYYNAVLACYGAWLRQQATERGLGFVDMYTPLNRISFEQRSKDPAFSMIGDAVHPGPDGQVVMAQALLKDLNVESQVSSVLLARGKDGWKAETKNAELSNLEIDGATIGFDLLAGSLPWVVPEGARQGYALSQAASLSGETLQLVGLDSGQYELKIDGNAVGTYSDIEWAGGIALQENSSTPQYQQALEVATLNKKRNEEAVNPLRSQWLELKRNLGMKETEPEKFAEWMNEFKKKTAELETSALKMEEEIYRVNQPRMHRYSIERVKE